MLTAMAGLYSRLNVDLVSMTWHQPHPRQPVMLDAGCWMLDAEEVVAEAGVGWGVYLPLPHKRQ